MMGFRVFTRVFGFASLLVTLASTGARAQQSIDFGFLPEEPSSEYVPVSANGPDHGFCAKWDPEYGYRGKACCERVPVFRKASAAKCSPQRIKWTFCDEMTPDQREYVSLAESGKLGNWWENRASFQQSRAYCSVNQGFLVHGRPLLGNSENRILIRNPNRCTNFGTDGLVGAMEWLGREIHRQYSDPAHAGVRLNVGDLSAPRGGCISGRRGRRGHASHTTGQDADIGFLNVKVGARELNAFSAQFDAPSNWWLLKRLFANPHACVKAVFVDKRLIRRLSKVASSDPEWETLRRHIKHIRGHRSHFHIRVGDLPGGPGCPNLRDPNLDFDPGDEEEEGSDSARVAPLLEVDAGEEEAASGASASWSAARTFGERISVSSSAPARAPSNSDDAPASAQ
jgi:murein endopeptidase